jgi:hypothetical protein
LQCFLHESKRNVIPILLRQYMRPFRLPHLPQCVLAIL